MNIYAWILIVVALCMPNSKQGFIAIDQWLNTRLGGMVDETLSARAYRNRNKKRRWHIAHRVIDMLFFWQAEHCMQSYVSEVTRKQLPPEYTTAPRSNKYGTLLFRRRSHCPRPSYHHGCSYPNGYSIQERINGGNHPWFFARNCRGVHIQLLPRFIQR